ncbi:MAG: hypothetical protein LQ350_004284 [Teloschistes chrysophthalmus]|nr:MAG: hypothetical protein LQ350_004284 [Niorma chrysophthalma]
MLRRQPTEIHLHAEEYLYPRQRAENINTAFIARTRWTRLMLLRLQKYDRAGLDEKEIFMLLRQEFNAPNSMEELRQERSFLMIGPMQNGFWIPAIEEIVVELSKRGANAQQISMELSKEHERPPSWMEVYRKMQQMKLDGVIE